MRGELTGTRFKFRTFALVSSRKKKKKKKKKGGEEEKIVLFDDDPSYELHRFK
jgi:hypothetical protein